ncbi:hypothetical protein ZWY2020_019266 [Hordeum vulgare]|nr:hypothetical protein ZWY2020_019266 [Hordeum vulgare]
MRAPPPTCRSPAPRSRRPSWSCRQPAPRRPCTRALLVASPRCSAVARAAPGLRLAACLAGRCRRHRTLGGPTAVGTGSQEQHLLAVEQPFPPAAPPSLEQPLPPSNAAARSYAGDHSIGRASTLSTGGAWSCFGIHWRANKKCILVRH